jgi:hypothetical protein
MADLKAQFEHLPGDPVVPLDRLVGIGVGPHGERARGIAALGKGLPQQGGGLRCSATITESGRRQL